MKKATIFSLSLLLLLNACKKDDGNDDTLAAAPKKLVKMSYENNVSAPSTIEYDAQGRVVRFDDGEDVTTFTYNGNEVKIKEFRTSENREVFSFTGQLNAKGYLVQGTAISQYNQSSVEGQTFTFEYDNNGYMTKKTRTGSGGNVYVYEYTYSKGNMIGFKVYLNGVFSYGGNWEYADNKADKSKLNWEQFNGPNTFTGKTNQLLPTKYTASSGWFVNMSYMVDNQGYATTNTLTFSNGDVSKVYFDFE
jgi:YD repeat-containing protein